MSPTPVAAQPLLLDTDIGTDIDDAYALVFAACSPEFDLRAVTTVNHDTMLRGRIARRLLDLMDRRHVPVVPGASVSLTPGERRGWMGHEGLGIELSDAEPGGQVPGDSAEEASKPDAAATIARCAEEACAEGTPLLVCPIGAMTNIAHVIRCYPDAASKIGRIVAMAADFGGMGPENARIEHNIACDSAAADIVLRSGIPITLVGLNVTQETAMTLADVDALDAAGGPLAKALVGMHRVWFSAIRGKQSPMHDGLALASVIDPTLLTLIDVIPQVKTHGPQTGYMTYSVPDAAAFGAGVCRIAVEVDAPRFNALFQGRVREACRTG